MKRCPKCNSLIPEDVMRCICSGWTLARQSLRVLMLDKELLAFPLLSGISCFLQLVGFFAGARLQEAFVAK